MIKYYKYRDWIVKANPVDETKNIYDLSIVTNKGAYVEFPKHTNDTPLVDRHGIWDFLYDLYELAENYTYYPTYEQYKERYTGSRLASEIESEWYATKDAYSKLFTLCPTKGSLAEIYEDIFMGSAVEISEVTEQDFLDYKERI